MNPTLKAAIEKVREEARLAHREICDLASGKRKWEMCVPPQKTDSDMTLQAPLDSIDRLTAALEKAMDDIASNCYCEKLHPDYGGKCGCCQTSAEVMAILESKS